MKSLMQGRISGVSGVTKSTELGSQGWQERPMTTWTISIKACWSCLFARHLVLDMCIYRE